MTHRPVYRPPVFRGRTAKGVLLAFPLHAEIFIYPATRNTWHIHVKYDGVTITCEVFGGAVKSLKDAGANITYM